jgi:signal transduction histidine kinase
MGWRLRLLTAVALLACVALFVVARGLGGSAHLDAQWRVDAQGVVRLAGTGVPALAPYQGLALQALQGATGPPLPADALWLQRSLRWQTSDTRRAQQLAQQQQLAQLMAQPQVTLHFAGAPPVTVAPAPRGWRGLGWTFWPLAGLALGLVLLGAVVLMAAPGLRTALYALMALGQAASLVFIAVGEVRGLGLPPAWLQADLPWRSALDVACAAALLHALALRPSTDAAPGASAPLRWAVVLAWAGAGAWAVLMFSGHLVAAWWWTQALVLTLGSLALALARRGWRTAPDPLTRVLRRLATAAVFTAWLLSTAVAATGLWATPALVADLADTPGVPAAASAWQLPVATLGHAAATLWTLLVVALLMLVPFLWRSRQLLREFALLAGVGTVAASLDLLFVAVFALGPLASFGLAVVIAVGLYTGARQWLLTRLTGRALISTERTFEQLYRAARTLQAQPQRHAAVLAGLLQEMFEPMALERRPAPAGLRTGSRVLAAGAALQVPLSEPTDETAARADAPDSPPAVPSHCLVLQHAQRGSRLFTADDARLADRVVEQLRRAAAYDRAVERGRSEERLRIAQDLHDDIGARLLTLMYQAPTREMEDYIRHTLKDLKTLTRGLAKSEHRLAEAAAEWKADLAQRTAAAHVSLGWSFSADRELTLSMVQWQALTRMLRELCSNVLAHAEASRLDVHLVLQGSALLLRVSDDGRGRAPETWSHGLGLGGVRKRVKQLGGTVAWRENTPSGIVCEVQLPRFAPAGDTPQAGAATPPG